MLSILVNQKVVHRAEMVKVLALDALFANVRHRYALKIVT